MLTGSSLKTGHNAFAGIAIIQDRSLKETMNCPKKFMKLMWNLIA